MLAGGTEESINDILFQSVQKVKATTKQLYPHAHLASRPFNIDRHGFVVAEGAGVVLLEELGHAVNRNARIYAEVVGYGQTADAHSLVQPLSTGQQVYTAMLQAIGNHTHIDFVNCHATSTQAGDIAELYALNQLANHLSDDMQLKVTANKGHLGHCLGAAGAIESIISLLSLYTGRLAGIANLQNSRATGYIDDPNGHIYPLQLQQPLSHKLSFLSQSIHLHNMQYALKNSFGFGGTNSSILFKKYS